MGTIPGHTSLQQETHGTDEGTCNNHRMQAYETTLEKVSYCESLLPTAVIGITDDKTRKDKEEIHGKITVWDRRPVKALKHMIQYHHQGCNTAQPV